MIVVDCSAVVDALTAADTTDLRARIASEDLHAPMLLDFEVVAALRGLTLGEHLSVARAEDALGDYQALSIKRWTASGELRRRAFQLRHNVSAYDAAYAVLADALSCPLLTRDAKLARSVRSACAVEVL